MTKKEIEFIWLKESPVRKRLIDWWKSLDENRGARARLRRVEQSDDVLLTEPFFLFLKNMPGEWAKKENMQISALVAASLSHVKEDHQGKTFAAQLATPKEGSDKPRVSELRFQQLQKSRDPDEFYRRLLRVIRLVESKVNICSLADDIWHWMKEYRFGRDRDPKKRLAVRWAVDYYETLIK